MTFSILFWNIWFHNQVEGEARYYRLLSEIKRLSDEHKPELIALAEAVRPSENKTSSVIEYLRELGYSHSHCANMVQLDDHWMSGVALSSRFPIDQKQNIIISKSGFAMKQGYEDLNKEAISVKVSLPGGQDFKIIVAHPTATIDSLQQHQIGKKNLNQLVRSKNYATNTILVGDMNEWRLMPGSLRRKTADVMHSRTGSALNPTWHHNARRFTPLRLNLDYVFWSKHSDFYLKDFRVLSSPASDHRPLLATFQCVTK